MKRCGLFLLLLIVTFVSCKKETEEPSCPGPTPAATPVANNYFKLAVGNYWVYETYKIDTNGVETLTTVGSDSSYVSGDTTWNGNTYYMLFDFLGTTWLRDSAGFMVDTTGQVYFTNAVFNLPVAFTYYGGNIGYNEKMTVSTPVSVTVPAGTFSCYDWKITAHLTDPAYQWGAIRYSHDYYSEGTGKVKQVFFFYSQPDTYERRLVRYHVQ